MSAQALSRNEACLEEDFPDRKVDALVIGSGYGGGVASLRLAEQGKGFKVAVLERGEEWQSGEFPDGMGKAFGQVRMRMPGRATIGGNPQGLFELRVGQGLAALVGNALGGTSQINANLLRKPAEAIFQRQRITSHGHRHSLWPAPLRARGALDAYYQRAREMLNAQALGQAFFGSRKVDGKWEMNGWGEPLKRKALKTLHQALLDAGLTARMDEAEWLTVRTDHLSARLGESGDLVDGQCTACGECVAGCNFNAKLTLTHSYLARARSAGAHLYTGATVQWLEKVPEGGWRVAYVPSGAEHSYEDGVRVPIKYLCAQRVVLAAGAFGSTEILLRSQARDGARLRFSHQLGQRLSTNGDNLAVVHLKPEAVNGVGVGAAGMARDGQAVGPTITGCIQVDNADVEQQLLIQDAAVPRALAGIYHELLTSFGVWTQLGAWKPLEPGTLTREHRPLHDWAALHPKSLSHAQLLLLIGHDQSSGSMSIDGSTGRLAIRYDARELAQQGDRQMRILDQGLGQGEGYLLKNPLLQGVRQVRREPSSEDQTFGGVTVHPLGGCCMGDDRETGVVDHQGRVFDPDAPESTGVHEGLYVLDGSIVPGSLGANPLWTITALAERACDHWGLMPAERQTRRVSPPLPPMRDKKTRAAAQRHVPVRFTEVLRAPAFNYNPHPHAEGAWQSHGARLLLHMPLPSLEAFAADPEHAVVLATPKLLPGREAGSFRMDDLSGQCVADMSVVGGTLHLLPVPRDSAWRRLCAAARVWATYRLTRFDDGGNAAGAAVGASMAWHMAEARVMTYRLQLREPPGQGHDAREYTLVGTKRVGYAASWRQLLRAVWGGRPPDRRNVWDAFTTLEARLYRSGGEMVGEGELKMDLVDLARYYAPQLGSRANTPDALVTLAGYATWMLRLLLVTRFPDVAPPPVAQVSRKWYDQPTCKTRPKWHKQGPAQISGTLLPYPSLQVMAADGRIVNIPAQGPYRFRVRRSREAKKALVELFLVHYPNTLKVEKNVRCGEGVWQTNAILLLNGFAQSTLSNVPEEFDRSKGELGMAGFFHEQGMDVWMLEYRLSPVLEASRCRSTMDEIAEFDIPKAVDRVLRMIALRFEDRPQGAKLQLHVFAHCIGAGALAMSILAGRLNHVVSIAGKEKPKAISKLASVTFSQIHPYLVGSESAQMRLQMAAVLQNLGGIDYLNLSPADTALDAGASTCKPRAPSVALETMLDGIFGSLPMAHDEQCPEDRSNGSWSAATCTCKRMSGVISRVLKHSQLKSETHARLPEYFGRANVGLLAHGGLCVERERLVDADGQNVYVTADQLSTHLNMPVALLHGTQNPLFDISSAIITQRHLQAYVPTMPCEGHRLIEAPSFAHFDCTISTDRAMRSEIYEPLQAFLKDAQRINGQPEAPPLRGGSRLLQVVQPPLAGPLLGWSRPAEDGNGHIQRVWIAIDEERTKPAAFAMTVVGDGADARVQTWKVVRVPASEIPPGAAETSGSIAVATADLLLNEADFRSGRPLRIAMVSVHEVPEHALTSSAGKLPGNGRASVPMGDQPISARVRERADRIHAGVGIPLSFHAKLLADLPPELREVFASLNPSRVAANASYAPEISDYELAPEEAARGLAGLRGQQESIRQAAMQAWPSTLVRRLRNAYPLGGKQAGMAWVRKELIQGGNTASLCFVAAGCQHPGTLTESDRADASMNAIAEGLENGSIPAQFMFLLGDQIYADATAGLTDSLSPIERIRGATLRAFNASGFRRVTTRLPTYMTPDDHEIENEWSMDRLDYLPRHERKQANARRLRDVGLAYIRAYQWMHSPCNTGGQGYLDYSFDAIGSRFYALDTRCRRRRFTQPQVCDPEQLSALEKWLSSSRSPNALHVLAMGSVLAPGLHAFDTGGRVSHPAADNWQLAPDQRRRVLEAIASCEASNIMLLSGDYHCSAVSVLRFFRDGNPAPFKTAYAVVAPPLYAPYPAFNAHPRDVLEAEAIELEQGCRVEINTDAWHGQGYSVIRMEHLAGGRRVLDVSMHLTLLDAGDAPRGTVAHRRLALSL